MRYIESELKEIIMKNYNDYIEKISGSIRMNSNLKNLSIDYLLFCLPLIKSNVMEKTNYKFKFTDLVLFYENNNIVSEEEKKHFFNFYKNSLNIDLREIDSKTLKNIEEDKVESAIVILYINKKFKEIESTIRIYQNIKEF